MSKIFGIGLSRTGTTSLALALHRLGYKTAHFRVGDRIIDDGIIEEYEALTDIPVACRFTELDRKYPGSRFIYTVRPISEWLDSCQRWLFRSVPARSPLAEVRLRVYGTPNFDRELFRRAYLRHDQAVREYFAGRDNLLVMNIVAGDGYEKLCPFLDVPVLDEPFPRVNVNCNKPFEVYLHECATA